MAGVRQFDEDRAFAQALALFWQNGYAGTSMQDVASATGIQRGSLYNAYGGKEALFLRVYERHHDGFLALVRQSLDEATLAASLRGFLEFLIGWMTDGEPARGCLTTKTAVAGGDIDGPIRAALQGLTDGLEGLLRERFSRADAASRLALSPARAARMVVTYTRGIVVLERLYCDVDRLREQADTLVELLLRPAADVNDATPPR